MIDREEYDALIQRVLHLEQSFRVDTGKPPTKSVGRKSTFRTWSEQEKFIQDSGLVDSRKVYKFAVFIDDRWREVTLDADSPPASSQPPVLKVGRASSGLQIRGNEIQLYLASEVQAGALSPTDYAAFLAASELLFTADLVVGNCGDVDYDLVDIDCGDYTDEVVVNCGGLY
jgi:hypothetical protein